MSAFRTHVDRQIDELLQRGIPGQQVGHVHQHELALHGRLVREVMIGIVAIHLPITACVGNKPYGFICVQDALAGYDSKIVGKWHRSSNFGEMKG